MRKGILAWIFILSLVLSSQVPLMDNNTMGINSQGEIDLEIPETGSESKIMDLLKGYEGSFHENLGQASPSTRRYYSIGDELSVFFSCSSVIYGIQRDDAYNNYEFRVKYPGANNVNPEGINPLDHRTNYIIGNDADRWVTGVRSYSEVWYRDLWDGIELRFYFQGTTLKYDFIIEPGINPEKIRLSYQGVEALTIEGGTGDLLVHTREGPIRDTAPEAYQEVDGQKNPVLCFYEVEPNCQVTFKTGEYDGSLPLIIDPGLEFSTYFGGQFDDFCLGSNGLDVGSDGSIYITGRTKSKDLPVTEGAFCITKPNSGTGVDDAFVAKFNSDASSLLYCTFIGGTGSDLGRAIVVDEEGQAIVVGGTSSTNFPLTPDAYSSQWKGNKDTFILKLNGTGSGLVYGTLIGGTSADIPFDVELGQDGMVYVMIWVHSDDFPTTSGSYCRTHSGNGDTVILKFSLDDGSIGYSTYIGGSEDDDGRDIVVDNVGNVYIVGDTWSDDYPVTPGAHKEIFDSSWECGFVVKIDPSGSRLLFSTYLGWECNAIALNDEGSIWVVGRPFHDIAVSPNAIYKSGWPAAHFLAQLSGDGSSILYATYCHAGFALSLDDNGNPIIYGRIMGDTLICPSSSFQGELVGRFDGFLEWFDTDAGRILNATYIGGSDLEHSNDIGDMVIAQDGTVVILGDTQSDDFPTTSEAFDSSYNGDHDSYIAGLSIEPAPWDLPSAPRNLWAVPNHGRVDLIWDPPAYDGGWPIVSYRIYVGESIGSQTFHAEVEDWTNFKVTGLESGKTYWFAVSAMTIVGEGPRTAPVSSVPSIPPGPPRDLSAEARRDSVFLEWSAPSSSGELPLAGYRIFRGERSDDIMLLRDLGNVTSFLDTEGISNGTRYYYRVQAYHALSGGPRGPVASAVPFGIPDIPLNLTAEAGDGSVTLAWDPPPRYCGLEITGYGLYRGISGAPLTPYKTLSSVSTFSDGGLTNGLTYTYAVCAINTEGSGPMSPSVNATPLALSGAPRNLSLEEGDGQLALTWAPPEETGGAPVLHYVLLRGDVPEFVEASMEILVTGNDHVDGNLINGNAYYYRVMAITAVGNGTHTPTISGIPFGPPGPPSNLNLTDENKRVDLSWEPPTNDGGRPILGYHIYNITGQSKDDRTLVGVVNATTTHAIDGLENGRMYQFMIIALNMAGYGTGVFGNVTPLGRPSEPTNFAASVENGTVILTWESPVSNGGSSTISYILLRGVTPDELEVLTYPGTEMIYVDQDVEPDGVYHYSILAVNQVGEGPRTSPLRVKVPDRTSVVDGEDLSWLILLLVAILVIVVAILLYRNR